MGSSLEALDPELRQGLKELTQLCSDNGLRLTITSTVRTRREQTFLWNRYQNGNSLFPAVPPLHSAHEYGWAFDALVTPNEAQQVVGGWWETYWGGTYGGKKDAVHFELPGAGKLAWEIGEQTNPQETVKNYPTLWDYGFWALDFTSLASALFELGYIVVSKEEAEKVARALHIDPQGRVF